MSRPLIFPNGIRLIFEEELPGPTKERAEYWDKVQSADIQCGYLIKHSDDSRFSIYVEANVDAPIIWDVFEALCEALLGKVVGLVISDKDEEPVTYSPVDKVSILSAMRPYSHQLSNDGSFQFGLVEDNGSTVVEVFLAASKHFEIWTSNQEALREVFLRFDIPEAESLQFIDEFPRVTVRFDALPTFESLAYSFYQGLDTLDEL